MKNIIDAHSHYMPPGIAENTTFFKYNWSDVDKQLKMMDDHGIMKSLLLYPTSDAHLQMGGWCNVCSLYNEKVAAVVREHPSRFLGAGILPLDDESKCLEELKRFEDLNLRVISLASSYDEKYLDEELFYPVFEFAQANSIPVYVHPQIIRPIGIERVEDPLLTPVLEYVFDVSMCIGKMLMSGVLDKFKDVSFVFAHYGGVLPFVKERFDNTYQMLLKRNYVKDLQQLPGEFFKNLYFDTSGSKSMASLLCALEVVDSSHVLYGSDFPANQHISQSISMIESSLIKEEERENIFFNSAASLLL